MKRGSRLLRRWAVLLRSCSGNRRWRWELQRLRFIFVTLFSFGRRENRLRLLAKAVFQGRRELCEHFFPARAALGYPDLAAGLDEEPAPVSFPINVQHHVVFDSIERN